MEKPIHLIPIQLQFNISVYIFSTGFLLLFPVAWLSGNIVRGDAT